MDTVKQGMGSTAADSFGATLRRRRVAAGLSQEELAERAGLSVRGVGNLEQGRRHAPRLATVRLLSDALGLDAAGRAELSAAARPELATGPATSLPGPDGGGPRRCRCRCRYRAHRWSDGKPRSRPSAPSSFIPTSRW